MEAAGHLTEPASRTFFGVPSVRDLEDLASEVAFLGVPYDGGTPEPGIPTGQRGGPAAVRDASVAILDYRPSDQDGRDQGSAGWYDVEAGSDHLAGVTMADIGDVAIQGSDTEGNYARITEAARAVSAAGSLMVAIGGDHSISYPLGLGTAEAAGGFDVVHIDAHADFYDELDGSRLTGASQLRRLAEMPSVGRVGAIGLRNADRVEVDDLLELGGAWATTRDVVDKGADEVAAATVTEGAPLYVTVDLDVLDGSIAPGHSLTEPGGLTYRQLRGILGAVARRGRVIAFDIAELNPSLDPSGATARVAAWAATHFLCEIFDQPR